MISDIFSLGSKDAKKGLIILHGRGGSAQEILSLGKILTDEKFIIWAPQASSGAWYPNSFLEKTEHNEPFLSQSIDSIKDLIDKMKKNIAQENLFLMGFSQGACLSLEVAARYPGKYGGIASFTGGLIGKVIDEKKYLGNLENTKIFISNGDQDPFIPLSRSQESKALLEKLGANVTLKVYPGRAHTVCEDEISWVRSNLVSNP